MSVPEAGFRAILNLYSGAVVFKCGRNSYPFLIGDQCYKGCKAYYGYGSFCRIIVVIVSAECRWWGRILSGGRAVYDYNRLVRFAGFVIGFVIRLAARFEFFVGLVVLARLIVLARLVVLVYLIVLVRLVVLVIFARLVVLVYLVVLARLVVLVYLVVHARLVVLVYLVVLARLVVLVYLVVLARLIVLVYLVVLVRLVVLFYIIVLAYPGAPVILLVVLTEFYFLAVLVSLVLGIHLCRYKHSAYQRCNDYHLFHSRNVLKVKPVVRFIVFV